MRTFHAIAYIIGLLVLGAALIIQVLNYSQLFNNHSLYTGGQWLLIILNGIALCVYTSECKPD